MIWFMLRFVLNGDPYMKLWISDINDEKVKDVIHYIDLCNLCNNESVCLKYRYCYNANLISGVSPIKNHTSYCSMWRPKYEISY